MAKEKEEVTQEELLEKIFKKLDTLETTVVLIMIPIWFAFAFGLLFILLLLTHRISLV